MNLFFHMDIISVMHRLIGVIVASFCLHTLIIHLYSQKQGGMSLFFLFFFKKDLH